MMVLEPASLIFSIKQTRIIYFVYFLKQISMLLMYLLASHYINEKAAKLIKNKCNSFML